TRDARDKGMGGKREEGARGDKSPRRGLPKDTPLSEKYRPKSGGFARNEERRRRFKEETARMGERRESQRPVSEAEEMLGRRRNWHALKSLGQTPTQPSIPASEGPFMRTRRRWKRPDINNDNNNEADKD
ncbi:MAG: hypothetical protein K2K92_09275, partial [Duncaniella sp.]|nr:hypothetical protein [Duncaniella sp.]